VAVYGDTPERRAAGLAFTTTTVRFGDGLAVRADDPTPYAALSEFRGQTVGTYVGSPPYANAITAAGAVVREFPTNPAAVAAAFAAGEIRAFYAPAPSYLFNRNVLGQLGETRFVETFQPQLVNAGAIVTRASDAALLAQLDAALSALKAEGVVA